PCQCLAETPLGRAPAIDVRRIQEIDSEIERTTDARDGELLALRIGECQPRAEANLRNQKFTISKLPIVHRQLPAIAAHTRVTLGYCLQKRSELQSRGHLVCR